MKKAFRVSLWDEDSEEQENEVETEEETYEEEVDDADDVEDIEVNFAEIFQEQYRRPCTIHTLQLLVKDCLKLLPAKFRNVLAKAKLVCKKQHKSVKLSEAMQCQLPVAGETRWNGQYRLLEKIHQNFDDVKGNIGIVVDSDLNIISSLISFLKPFYIITKQLEYEKLSTIQEIIH